MGMNAIAAPESGFAVEGDRADNRHQLRQIRRAAAATGSLPPPAAHMQTNTGSHPKDSLGLTGS